MSELENINSNKVAERTPNLIAAEINSIKDQTKRMVLYNSIEIGRRLVEAKEILPHGEWGTWLKDSVDYSQSTANNLMKIFNDYGADQISLLGGNVNSQAFANLSYSQAVALFSIPSEERETFVKDNNIEEKSSREIKELIKEKQELEKRLKEADDQLKEKDKSLNKVLTSYTDIKKTNEKNEENAKKLREELKEIKEKNKEIITNKEVEIENLKIAIAENQKKLEEAKEQGTDEEVKSIKEELAKKESELNEATLKINELQKQIEEKPVEVNAEIPEEVQKELQELREKVNQASVNKEPGIKFSIYFSEIVKNFQELLKAFEEVEDEEMKEKYNNAVLGLINKMSEKLL